MRITLNEFIDADPDRTFEVFSDIANAPDRVSGIKQVTMLTDGPIGRGARFRETRVMFGKDATEDLEFTEFQPPKSYTIGCESCGVYFTSTFTFTPEAGGTRVAMDMRSRSLSLKAKLMAPMCVLFAGSAKKAMRQDLLDLKAFSEGEAAPTTAQPTSA